MRSFSDSGGRRWQAALLDASYGSVVLVFSPQHGDEIRQLLMPAPSLVEAEAQLAGFDDDALRTRLADAAPWDRTNGTMKLA